MLLLDTTTCWSIYAAGSTPPGVVASAAAAATTNTATGGAGRGCRLPGYSSAASASAAAQFATTATQVLRLECFARCFAETASRGGQVLQAFALKVLDLLTIHRVAVMALMRDIEAKHVVAQGGGGGGGGVGGGGGGGGGEGGVSGGGGGGGSSPSLGSLLVSSRPIRSQIQKLAKLCRCMQATIDSTDSTDATDIRPNGRAESNQSSSNQSSPSVDQVLLAFAKFPRGARLLSYLYDAAINTSQDDAEATPRLAIKASNTSNNGGGRGGGSERNGGGGLVGGRVSGGLAGELLTAAMKPYLAMLSRWIFRGDLVRCVT